MDVLDFVKNNSRDKILNEILKSDNANELIGCYAAVNHNTDLECALELFYLAALKKIKYRKLNINIDFFEALAYAESYSWKLKSWKLT
jgi:hypothetical protein